MQKKPIHTNEILFHRRGNIIKQTNGTVEFIGTYTYKGKRYPSVNAAKRKSRELQNTYGQGSLRILK